MHSSSASGRPTTLWHQPRNCVWAEISEGRPASPDRWRPVPELDQQGCPSNQAHVPLGRRRRTSSCRCLPSTPVRSRLGERQVRGPRDPRNRAGPEGACPAVLRSCHRRWLPWSRFSFSPGRPADVIHIRPARHQDRGLALRPQSHKTEHHGRRGDRVGAGGSEILQPWLKRDPEFASPGRGGCLASRFPAVGPVKRSAPDMQASTTGTIDTAIGTQSASMRSRFRSGRPTSYATRPLPRSVSTTVSTCPSRARHTDTRVTEIYARDLSQAEAIMREIG